ncbi:tetratricopeptide repeat protein [Desulfolucanica intricata]|uniref:tetratricopeptide repeat protein n=1 Tax=Desulfolucanica intricata TaxID=1285191 RepID=UPI000832ECBF|nr:tetratricopeptide repeat protein [Desulfolucanica intricata]
MSNLFMGFRSKRKKQIKIVFWLIIIALSIGLVGSSVMWALGPQSSKNTQAEADRQQQQQMDPARLIKDLETKVKANPKDTENLEKLADAYEMNNKKEQALETYEKVIALDPENTRVGLILVKKYFLEDKYDQAEERAKNIISVEPDNPQAHYYYGLILGFGKKDYQGGIAELEKFIELAKTGTLVQETKELVKEWKNQIDQTQQ